jgi:hypothetical protein
MADVKQKIIGFLLENANPSIVMRVKKEVLSSITAAEETDCISRIVSEKNVQSVLTSQKEDGWFGNSFHGQSPKSGAGMYDNMEVGLRYLSEKGFPHDNEYISRAVNSFLTKEPFDSAYGVKPPDSPDDDYAYTASGLYLARSSVIIRAGCERTLAKNDIIDLKRDIDFSLATFLNVLNYTSQDEIIDTHRRKAAFKPGIMWPCLYHLRMLAHSGGWRSDANIARLSESVNHLLSFPQTDEMVYTYKKGQFVGPCFALINAQMNILELNDKDSISLDILELFARCGVVSQVGLLREKYEYLLSLIDDELNFRGDIRAASLGWSPYFGFALEENWRDNKRKLCDILFRTLLIIHYTENDARF